MPKPSNMPSELMKVINRELHNAELYRILARSAPDEEARAALDRFSRECRESADTFSRLWSVMTGKRFEPMPEPVRESGSFRSVLRGQIRRELASSALYRELYMRVSDNMKLKRALFTAAHNAMLRAASLALDACN